MTAMSYEDLAARVAALEERLDIQEGLRASQDRDLGALEQRTRALLSLAQATVLNVSDLSGDLRTLSEDLRGDLRTPSGEVRSVRSSQIEHSTLLGEIIARLERIAPEAN